MISPTTQFSLRQKLGFHSAANIHKKGLDLHQKFLFKQEKSPISEIFLTAKDSWWREVA